MRHNVSVTCRVRDDAKRRHVHGQVDAVVGDFVPSLAVLLPCHFGDPLGLPQGVLHNATILVECLFRFLPKKALEPVPAELCCNPAFLGDDVENCVEGTVVDFGVEGPPVVLVLLDRAYGRHALGNDLRDSIWQFAGFGRDLIPAVGSSLPIAGAVVLEVDGPVHFLFSPTSVITEPGRLIIHFKRRARPASRASHCYAAFVASLRLF